MMTEADIQMDLTAVRMNPDKYEQRPIQVLGTVNGYPFLFYARWDFWDFSIPLDANVDVYAMNSAEHGFYREGSYGHSSSNSAEDMSDEQILGIIRECASEFVNEHLLLLTKQEE